MRKLCICVQGRHREQSAYRKCRVQCHVTLVKLLVLIKCRCPTHKFHFPRFCEKISRSLHALRCPAMIYLDVCVLPNAIMPVLLVLDVDD